MVEAAFLGWLEEWYSEQCDGLWEHSYGISIRTIDNPGWAIEINLKGTECERVHPREVVLDRSDLDWYRCWIEGNKFHGAGGSRNLNEIIGTFRKWVEGC